MESHMRSIWIKVAGWLGVSVLGVEACFAVGGGPSSTLQRSGTEPSAASGAALPILDREDHAPDDPSSEEEIWMAIMKYCVCC